MRILVNGHRVIVGSMTFQFSTPEAAAQAQCTLREPKHVPRGGNKFDRQDVITFVRLKAAYTGADNDA
jgi:hypothetical protein